MAIARVPGFWFRLPYGSLSKFPPVLGTVISANSCAVSLLGHMLGVSCGTNVQRFQAYIYIYTRIDMSTSISISMLISV